jgi:hypothetical protein
MWGNVVRWCGEMLWDNVGKCKIMWGNVRWCGEMLWDNVGKCYEIMWGNTVKWDRSQMAIWRMRTVCYIPKATNTHSEYVILTALPLQQQSHKRASILRHTYIACLDLTVPTISPAIIIPPFHYSTIPSFHHYIIPSFHHPIIPPLHYSTIPPFHNSIIPLFYHSTIPSFHYSTTP